MGWTSMAYTILLRLSKWIFLFSITVKFDHTEWDSASFILNTIYKIVWKDVYTVIIVWYTMVLNIEYAVTHMILHELYMI